MFAGWVGRRQTAVIDYLIEENRVLKEQLEFGGKRLRFTDDQRRRLARSVRKLKRAVAPPLAERVPAKKSVAFII